MFKNGLSMDFAFYFRYCGIADRTQAVPRDQSRRTIIAFSIT